MIFVGKASLRHAVRQYLSHYHGERNHQGPGNRLLIPLRVGVELHIPVKRRQRHLCFWTERARHNDSADKMAAWAGPSNVGNKWLRKR